MIRVLQVLGGLNFGGAETMVMNLYRAMDRSKIQFDFIIHLPEKQAYEDEVLSMGGKIFRFPKFKGKNYFSQKRLWDNFFGVHPEYKILHSHVRSYASLYLPIAKKYGVKTIVHSHSTSNGRGFVSNIKSIMQYPLRYQADYCFGCSEEAGKWLFGEKVYTGSKYYMFKNAIDIKKYQMSTEIREKYRKELKVDANCKVFIHVGRLHEAKNHLFLLEVFEKYHRFHINSILVIVGNGELENSIQEKVNSLGIQEKVKMLGARNDVPDLLKAADCFLFPSKWEGLPVTVVEAQAAGLPCLVSDTITRDVNVTGTVCNLPIDRGIDPWINKMIKMSFERKNVIDEIIRAGFDIRSSARDLSEFYKRVFDQ